MLKEDLLNIFADNFRQSWDTPALTDYTSGETLTYGELARRIARTHLFYELSGVKPGEKIALIGKNTISWVVTYMATITYGATIVPILHDFNPQDAQHIINHSDSVMLYVSDNIWEHLDFERMPAIKMALSLDNQELLGHHTSGNKAEKVLSVLGQAFNKRYPYGYGRNNCKYRYADPSSVAEINYTSGTTGFSKGVMLTYNNLCGNVVYGIRSCLHYRGSRCLSFLPLAHAYGCAFDMLVPLAVGTHITLLGKLPSPKVLLKALSEVKPSLIICVPLILEKIYRKQLQPILSKPSMRRLLAIPIVRGRIYAKIRKTLVEAFGGEFEQVIVGGAPLNPEVEQFLLKIKFPFSVGYGMTECGPLISFTPWREFIGGSSGRTLKGFMFSKVTSDNESYVPGEICVKGENVMKGYYKNSEATEAVLDADGWLHTGDMGTISNAGTIFIKGRYKTMILTANGQNIYPEEIESKLNNMPYVAESIVIDRGGKLVALIYPDLDAARVQGLGPQQLQEAMRDNITVLNAELPRYSQISDFNIYQEEFEKTAKRSIKRYLYK